MTPSAQYAAVAEILDALIADTLPADVTLKQYVGSRRYIGSKDRRAISDTFFDVLRHWYRLCYVLQDTGLPLDGRGLCLAHLKLVQQADADVIADFCDSGGYGLDVLNDSERTFIHNEMLFENLPESVRLECPEWAWPMLMEQRELLVALQDSASPILRVNTLKTTRDTLQQALSDADIASQQGVYSPMALKLEGRQALQNLDVWRDGHAEMQDESAQIASLLLDVQPEMQVLDYCAGAGGKTLALAALMNNTGNITACDVETNRLQALSKRLARAGVINVTTLSAEQLSQQAVFDRVLVDAPCTGSGTWRRQPELRWRYTADDLAHFVRVQAEILEQAALYVKPGGLLLYATCSIYPPENQEQVARFTAQHPKFAPIDLAAVCARTLTQIPEGVTGSMLQLSPHLHQTDGFFVALWRRDA